MTGELTRRDRRDDPVRGVVRRQLGRQAGEHDQGRKREQMFRGLKPLVPDVYVQFDDPWPHADAGAEAGRERLDPGMEPDGDARLVVRVRRFGLLGLGVIAGLYSRRGRREGSAADRERVGRRGARARGRREGVDASSPSRNLRNRGFWHGSFGGIAVQDGTGRYQRG